MPALKHVHKYWGRPYKHSRLKRGRKTIEDLVMACAHPDCLHYITLEEAVGRRSICWKCEKQFILGGTDGPYPGRPDRLLRKPLCPSCRSKQLKFKQPEKQFVREEVTRAATKLLDKFMPHLNPENDDDDIS